MRMIDQRLVGEVGACFVAVHHLLAGANGRLAPEYDSGDGVHPNDQGHLLIQGQISSRLHSGSCVKLVQN
jgi:lysophospholipase L1-like esterase